MTTTDVDVIVVGAGPGGTTVANLLAQCGWAVRVFEREHFPRYHIGESLQAGTNFIWQRLGIQERLAQAGFVVKRGGTYRWGQHKEPWSVEFAEEGGFPSAYQVERDRFDQILADRAMELGVDIRFGHSVRELLREDGRVVGVRVTDESGAEHAVRARYVVDASGQDRLSDPLLPARVVNPKLGRAALWSYFEGAGRLDGDRAGHIFAAAFASGWMWHIPLSRDRVSVGVVLGDAFQGRSGQELQSVYDSLIDGCAPMRDLVRQGRQCDEVRRIANWSYHRNRVTAPGLVAVGDAARFVDPILSAGVFLAMLGGYVAAVALNSCLNEPEREARFVDFLDDWMRAAFDTHVSMAEYWYDAEGVEDDFFWHSRRLVDPASHITARRAFVYATSGYVGNLAALDQRARIDAENFRHLGVRGTERFADVDVARTHQLHDELGELGRIAADLASVGGPAVRVPPLPGSVPGPTELYINGFRLVDVPVDLPVPRGSGSVFLLARERNASSASFLELQRAPARAFRTVGSVALGYRARSAEDRVGLAHIERVVALLQREADTSVCASPEAAAAWLLERCRDPAVGLDLMPWQTAYQA